MSGQAQASFFHYGRGRKLAEEDAAECIRWDLAANCLLLTQSPSPSKKSLSRVEHRQANVASPVPGRISCIHDSRNMIQLMAVIDRRGLVLENTTLHGGVLATQLREMYTSPPNPIVYGGWQGPRIPRSGSALFPLDRSRPATSDAQQADHQTPPRVRSMPTPNLTHSQFFQPSTS